MKGIAGGSVKKRALKEVDSVILFLTLVVHNSVVYAVLYVTKNVWYYLHFFVPLTDMKKKIQNVMNNVN